MSLEVNGLSSTARFDSDFKAAPDEIAEQAKAVLALLLTNPAAGKLRLHTLKGYGKPSLFKVDVCANRAWQITSEMD